MPVNVEINMKNYAGNMKKYGKNMKKLPPYVVSYRLRDF